jgi:hypothetical protein
MLAKVFARSSICVFSFLLAITMSSMYISLHLVFDDGLHHPTERGADILEAFGHPEVIIGAERCDEVCFSSFLLWS